ncbi:MAG: flagellar hook-length control protein FliK [Moraxellaceae bacterium]|nr:flagellar hook-length control protein FliK [Moraxellaceae bacterium]MDZ4387072.1 flagellar hook-length control protein FliK [Moraxellaceae bacterium]
MSNLFAALTPMPTSPVRSAILLPETSAQPEEADLAALFAGVLATMMPVEALPDELPDDLPKQMPPLASEPAESADNTALFAQMPELATPLVSPMVLTNNTALTNDTVDVVLNQLPKVPPMVASESTSGVAALKQQAKAELPLAVADHEAATLIDEDVLAQLPKKPLTVAMSASPVINQVTGAKVVQPAEVITTTQAMLPTQAVTNTSDDGVEPNRAVPASAEQKPSEAVFAALTNKPVLATSVPTTSTTAAVVSVPVSIHNERAFSEAFGLQLVKLASQGITQATVRINPQELGPIDVRIVMSGQHTAQVDFQARQSQTADLLEAMMPRLVSAMEAQGIRLDDARVATMSAADAQSFAQQFGRQGQEAQAETFARGQGRSAQPAVSQGEEEVGESPQHMPNSEPGRIDYYA